MRSSGSQGYADGMAIEGTWAAALTPLKSNLSPHQSLFARHVKTMLRDGCHGVVVFGTTGEGTAFSADEKIAATAGLINAGVDPGRIVVGTAALAALDVRRIAEAAADLGCAAVLVLPPFYPVDLTDEGLYAAYAQLLARVKIPVLAYHFPKQTHRPLSGDLLARLSNEFGDRMAGVKDSSGDQASLADFLRLLPGKAVLPGTEHLLLWGLNQGTAGVITAGANVNAAGIRAVWDAFKANDAGAVHLQGQASGLRNAFQGLPMIAALKYFLASRTGEEAWQRLRPPLVPLSDDQRFLLDRKLGLLRR